MIICYLYLKDLAISLTLEAAELLEKSQVEMEEYVVAHNTDIGEEIADSM